MNRRGFLGAALASLFVKPAVAAAEAVGLKAGPLTIIATGRGKATFDAAMFYCPYVPLMTCDPINGEPMVFEMPYQTPLAQ